MRILLVTSMVPDPAGVGAIPKLLAAQLAGLRERGHEITLVTTFGEDPGQAEAAAELLASALDAHILANNKHALIPPHLFLQRLGNRADISHKCHNSSNLVTVVTLELSS